MECKQCSHVFRACRFAAKKTYVVMPKGKRLNRTAKKIVCSVYTYFEEQHKKNKVRTAAKLSTKTAQATGYSVRTVERVVAKKRTLSGAAFESPAKRYKASRVRIVADDFDTEAIRRTIHEFYERKEYPTLKKLSSVLRGKNLFTGHRTTLWKLLHKIGFTYKKVNDKRYIYEQPRRIEWRHRYLRRMRKNRRENRPVVFLDETWANAHDGRERAWVETDQASGGTKGGVRKPSGKGSRLIILHAGSCKGWINGAELVFQSKKSTGDYHDEMTSEHFEEWFNDTLIPKLEQNSIIVMDNASYHSRRLQKIPTKSSNKQEMKDWLTAHGIQFPERALKCELHSSIMSSNPVAVYAVDEIAKAAGHEVVHLPPYHCELNPIEMAWAQVKGYIREHNTLFTLTHVKELTHTGFAKVGEEEWQKLVKHVQDKVEDKFWEEDALQETYIEEFIIRTGGSDSEGSSESDSDSDISCSSSDDNDGGTPGSSES